MVVDNGGGGWRGAGQDQWRGGGPGGNISNDFFLMKMGLRLLAN